MSIWTPVSKQSTSWTPESKQNTIWTPKGDIKEIIFDSSYDDSEKFTKIILNNTSNITLSVKSINFISSIWTAI